MQGQCQLESSLLAGAMLDSSTFYSPGLKILIIESYTSLANTGPCTYPVARGLNLGDCNTEL